MNTQANQKIKIGDKVTFDTDKVEFFKAETNRADTEIQEYRKEVLGAIEKVGVVTELGFRTATVSYGDNWNIGIPIKYLIVLPEA